MNRIAISPRHDWQAKVEEVGLTFHTPDGNKYWDESAYYQLTAGEVDVLEKAANDLHGMCIGAAQQVIDENRFSQLGIPEAAVPYIKNSWDRDDFSLYGRFDLAYDGRTSPKMLEYNADTPTALVEAAVAQWYWLQDTNKHADQFNSIHERLIGAWTKYRDRIPGDIYLGGVKNHLEDAQTVLYVEDTCHQAGLPVKHLFIEDLGFDSLKRRFVDLEDKEVSHYFKLYPWEWMWHEEFSSHLKLEICHFIEPMWKMLLSNKGLLPILWEKFPGHPNLLPAYFTEEAFLASGPGSQTYVKKPKLSREGANVAIVEGGRTVAVTEGDYGEEGYIYQAVAPLSDFDGNHPVMGVWVVDHEACGLGIREDTGRITGNLSRFVPHLF
jgi:glutathionylspermidine synthase